MCAVVTVLPKRILIIDDDIDLLMLLERRLGNEGFTIETAASLPEAEEVLYYFDPHLVLLDVNVNGDDGRQLCWKLKSQKTSAELKVLLMSGFDCSKCRASLFGADDVLAKPMHTDFLLHKINFFLHPSSDDAQPGNFLSSGGQG
jgi:DNA-binding response OmpR family regulator